MMAKNQQPDGRATHRHELQPRCGAPLVIMGVSGSGKSTFGSALARALDMSFVDGDDLHPAANVDKMRRGDPLNDDDREPWLRAITAVLKDDASHPSGVVVACSALKRRYRDTLRAAHGLRFVFLDAERRLAEERVEARPGHFMPSDLIASQFEALERPDDTETDVVTVDARLPVGAAVRAAIDLLGERSSAAQTQEQSILRSWNVNAAPWTHAVREERIDSRTHVTNRAIIEPLLALSVRRVLDNRLR